MGFFRCGVPSFGELDGDASCGSYKKDESWYFQPMNCWSFCSQFSGVAGDLSEINDLAKMSLQELKAEYTAKRGGEPEVDVNDDKYLCNVERGILNDYDKHFCDLEKVWGPVDQVADAVFQRYTSGFSGRWNRKYIKVCGSLENKPDWLEDHFPGELTKNKWTEFIAMKANEGWSEAIERTFIPEHLAHTVDENDLSTECMNVRWDDLTADNACGIVDYVGGTTLDLENSGSIRSCNSFLKEVGADNPSLLKGQVGDRMLNVIMPHEIGHLLGLFHSVFSKEHVRRWRK